MLDDFEFNLYLIRHGESEINIIPDNIGQDPFVQLTKNGQNQANLLKQNFFYNSDGSLKLKYDFVFSSPYDRARNTAEIALNYKYIRESEALQEYNPGNWLNCSRSNTITDSIKLKMSYFTSNFQPPNGESISQVERRVSDWLDNCILYSEEKHNFYKEVKRPLEIVAFSHGMTIKCLLHYILDFDKSMIWKIDIDNTSISKVSFGKQGWRLHYINNCSHLIIR